MAHDVEAALRREFGPIAKRLEKEYAASVRHAFSRFMSLPEEARRVIQIGRQPQGMSFRESEIETASFRRCRRYVTREGGRFDGAPSLSEDFLAKEAARYGEEQANAFTAKLARKLDGAEDVKLVWNSGSGVDFTISASAGGDSVVLSQQSVLKAAPRTGQPFHQFPARISVNGKFTPEAEFRDMMEARAAEAAPAPEPDDAPSP